jgi:hypothetical protein
MQTHFRPTLILVAAILGAAGIARAADNSATTQIYQQRDADGHAVFTDRPSPKSVTERTWQMNREDPVAAQQRAFEVKREADAVSERVQRTIEAQLRRASEEDMMRMQLAMAYPQSNPSDFYPNDYGYYYPVAFGGPFCNGARNFSCNRRPFPIDNKPSKPPHMQPMRPGGGVRGPAGP